MRGMHGSKGLRLNKGMSLRSILWAWFALAAGLGIQLGSYLLSIVGFQSLGSMEAVFCI